MALCIAALTTYAKDNQSDTILSVQNAKNITITENADGMKVVVKGNGDDDKYVSVFEEKYSKNVKLKSNAWNDFSSVSLNSIKGGYSSDDLVINGFCLGLVNANGAPSQAGFELGKSWEISLVNMIAYRHMFNSRTGISIGFGMDWRTYRNSKGTTRFMLDDAGKVVCGAFPEGVKPEGSQIKVVRVGFPIMWNQRIGSSSSFQLGAILNMTSHASVKSSWVSESGNRVNQYDGDINTRFFTVDLMGIYKFNRWVGIYGRWTPQSVLRASNNASPKFSTLSFGLTLVL